MTAEFIIKAAISILGLALIISKRLKAERIYIDEHTEDANAVNN